MSVSDRKIPASEYARAFEAERARLYPPVAHFEEATGFRLERDRLEDAARVLACPVKANPPNWQHGRILYAAVRKYVADHPDLTFVNALDIGTAKGFSALMLEWALSDAGVPHRVTSVDVIDPAARQLRNTVAECDGVRALDEILAPWPEARRIQFRQSTGIDWLQENRVDRIHVAFVDGKHSGHVVRKEGLLLAQRQRSGDLVVFDDVHIPDVSEAVVTLQHEYQMTYLDVLPNRSYAIGVRR